LSELEIEKPDVVYIKTVWMMKREKECPYCDSLLPDEQKYYKYKKIK